MGKQFRRLFRVSLFAGAIRRVGLCWKLDWMNRRRRMEQEGIEISTLLTWQRKGPIRRDKTTAGSPDMYLHRVCKPPAIVTGAALFPH